MSDSNMVSYSLNIIYCQWYGWIFQIPCVLKAMVTTGDPPIFPGKAPGKAANRPKILGLLDMSQSTNWRAPTKTNHLRFSLECSKSSDGPCLKWTSCCTVGGTWGHESFQLGIILPIDYIPFFRGVETNHQPDITWYYVHNFLEVSYLYNPRYIYIYMYIYIYVEYIYIYIHLYTIILPLAQKTPLTEPWFFFVSHGHEWARPASGSQGIPNMECATWFISHSLIITDVTHNHEYHQLIITNITHNHLITHITSIN